ncbi:hypothetical protein Rctr197k_115 [Virus Rctr197k]|nr:hypothetical protein Rctr197k_115 [Virus Rctr197k]
MKSDVIHGHQVVSDGKTVWVNGPDGGCVARFSFTGGIDIHKTAMKQIETGKACLDCKPGPSTSADWEHFKEQVALHYALVIPDDHRPEALGS